MPRRINQPARAPGDDQQPALRWVVRLLDQLEQMAQATGQQLPAPESYAVGGEPPLLVGERRLPGAATVIFTPERLRIWLGSAFPRQVAADSVRPAAAGTDGRFHVAGSPGLEEAPHLGYVAVGGKITITAHPSLPRTADGLPDLGMLTTPPGQWIDLPPAAQVPANPGEPGVEFDRPGPLLRAHEQTARTLMPPVVQRVFQLCGPDKSADALGLLHEEERVGLKFPAVSKRENFVSLAPAHPVPQELRNARQKERLNAWLIEQTQHDLCLLDELCWDVFMAGLVTFFKRTQGQDIRERFDFLFTDVFAYRGTRPNKQTPELKQAILDRMKYLSSQRLALTSCQPIHVLDPSTKRKKLQECVLHGPAFGWLGDVYSRPGGKLATGGSGTVQGVRWTLGEWARELVSNEAYLGQIIIRLGRYHVRRQLWERRLGFYLLFQLYNQATRATWREVDGVLRMVAPQQPITLEKILNGTGMDWKKLGREHPGMLVTQITSAFRTLERDGLPSVECIDGVADGSDLDARGRLPQLLKRRFNPIPGPLLEPHLAAKAQVKAAAVQKGLKAQDHRQRQDDENDRDRSEGRQ